MQDDSLAKHSLLQWIRQTGLHEKLQSALRLGDDSPIVLQVDAMQAACSNPFLGLNLLQDPDAVRSKLIGEILDHGVHPSTAERVWLRVTGAPLPLSPVGSAAASSSCCVQTLAGSPIPVRFIGICAAISSVGCQMSSQLLKCLCCKEAQTLHVVAGVPRHASGDGRAGLCQEQWEEDVSGRTSFPVQEAWFTALQSSSGACTRSPHLTSVVLCGEDLCGKLAIGQCAIILGCMEATSPGSPWSIDALQVKANNMTMLSPRAAMASPATSAEWDRWQTDMLSEPKAVLSNLSEALAAWLQPQPVQADMLLALLLSAVTAGQSPNHTSNGDRSQVHVLIGCEGHEAGLMQIVKRASKLLTPHCVFHGASNALLPKAQSYPVSGVEKGVRVDAGSPGLAASGVLVLQTYQLKKKEQDSLAHILEHDSVVLCPDPALNVPVTATLWLTAEQDDIEQACNGSSKGRIGTASAKPNVSGKLMGHFDIVTSYSTSKETDMELDAINHILDRPAGSYAGCQKPSIEQMSALGRCMKRHMAMAACMQQPSMTAAATNFLQQYFMALRLYDGDCEVTAGTLSSLARLAAASARLHLRDSVLALPDAVLAIVTFERSCEYKGLRSQMARDICATLNVVPDGEELDDQLQATYTALKAHFAGRDMDIAREE